MPEFFNSGKDCAISVIVPAFNAAATLPCALQSIFAQTSPPEEVIVVDDGSSDDTFRIAEAFAPEIRVVRQANQGAAVARQTGTELARSPYIAYLDADDWWPVDKLAVCRSILRVQEVDFLFADLQRAKPNDPESCYLPRNTTFFPWAEKYFTESVRVPEIEDLYLLEPRRGLALVLDGFPVFPSTMLVRKSAIEAVGGWDPQFRRCQDFDVAIRLARQYPTHFHHWVGAVLGLHGVNTDADQYCIKQLNGDIAVLMHHLQRSPENDFKRQVAIALGKKYRGLGYLYRTVGDSKRAHGCYREAMKLPGRRLHSGLRYLATSFS